MSGTAMFFYTQMYSQIKAYFVMTLLIIWYQAHDLAEADRTPPRNVALLNSSLTKLFIKIKQEAPC